MALHLHNRKIYPFVFGGSIVAVLTLWYPLLGFSHGQLCLGVVGAVTAFFYFWYKQHLDETKLFKELFTEFNRRYDRLNSRLNRIISSRQSIGETEKYVVFDYFNLCAEEYFFYRANYIDESVWKAWLGGIAFFFNDPRIRALWECQSPNERASYYGFEPPPYQSLPAGDPEKSAEPIPSHRGGTKFVPDSRSWQGDTHQNSPTDEQFLVRAHFPAAPPLSIERSQKFVNVAMEYDGVKAFANDPGIGFDPNFVFIERVYTEEEGFVASFYGDVQTFRRYGQELEPGRTPASYSRLKVKSFASLDRAIACLHISAKLRNLHSQ